MQCSGRPAKSLTSLQQRPGAAKTLSAKWSIRSASLLGDRLHLAGRECDPPPYAVACGGVERVLVPLKYPWAVGANCFGLAPRFLESNDVLEHDRSQ